MELLVFSEIITNRLRYIFEFIFKDLLGVDVQITANQDEFSQWTAPSFSYGTVRPASSKLHFPATSTLFQSHVYNMDVPVGQVEGDLLPFPVEDSSLGFDPFAAAFYIISRYEEVVEHQTDSLGRFPAAQSLMCRLNCLEKPIIHIWAEKIAQKISALFPGFLWRLPAYRFIPSYDIDVAFAYQGRSWLHTSGTLMRDLVKGKPGLAEERLSVVCGFRHDPYDAYDYLEACMAEYKLDPVFFFLLGKRSPMDHNLRYNGKVMRRLIRRIAEKYQVGIHPSSLSSVLPGRLEIECQRLEEVLGREVKISRQHFLMMTFPETLRKLERCGLTDDYSMGFADLPGFRAGVAIPFQYFDVTQNEVTGIRVHPLMVMDGTLNHYLKLNPEEAKSRVEELVATTRKWGGDFMSLWHNSSLSEKQEWKSWKSVHDHLLKCASNENYG